MVRNIKKHMRTCPACRLWCQNSVIEEGFRPISATIRNTINTQVYFRALSRWSSNSTKPRFRVIWIEAGEPKLG